VPTETPSLSLVGVSKSWPGRDGAVLDDVSLVLPPGTAVRIGGANGAGKTTLLRIAAGLIRPETGRIRLGALDVEADRTAFQRCVGFLSAASAGLYARLTVRDHLRLWSRLALLPSTERAASCERVLDALGLRQLADRRVDRLSMGQRQRVRLAGVFLHDPRVVMLDEPTTSLDEDGADLLVAEVERVRSGGGTALWCAPTSEVSTSLNFDTRLVLREGHLHEDR
jgi:ABC-type multidrug transport system ATPase subunit